MKLGTSAVSRPGRHIGQEVVAAWTRAWAGATTLPTALRLVYSSPGSWPRTSATSATVSGVATGGVRSWSTKPRAVDKVAGMRRQCAREARLPLQT